MYGEYCSKDEYTGAKECASYHIVLVAFWHFTKAANDYGVAITALATVFVAAFTGTLWWASAGQYDLLKQQIAVAKESADAANLSAKAAVAVELPIIVLCMIQLLKQTNPSVQVVGYPDAVSTLRFNFKNFGRTAGELITMCAEWSVAERLPDAPNYKSNYPFIPGAMIEPQKMLPPGPQNFTIRLQPEEVTAISEETKFLWVYGYLAFRDFLGNEHRQGWCAKWQGYRQTLDGSLAPLGFVYDPKTPPEYTKRT